MYAIKSHIKQPAIDIKGDPATQIYTFSGSSKIISIRGKFPYTKGNISNCWQEFGGGEVHDSYFSLHTLCNF